MIHPPSRPNSVQLPASIVFSESPLPEHDLVGGVCFRSRDASASAIDTVVVHSCYVPDAVRAPDPSLVPQTLGDKEALALRAQWKASSDPRFENAALFTLLKGRYGERGLERFCVDGVKAMFEFYGVSAHYVVTRNGEVIELVHPELLAFHAGRSKLPSDGRESVNGFSVGIELLADEVSGYTDSQLAALRALVDGLMLHYPITAVYGHSDIAPERKTDPWNFNWQQFLSGLKQRPTFHP